MGSLPSFLPSNPIPSFTILAWGGLFCFFSFFSFFPPPFFSPDLQCQALQSVSGDPGGGNQRRPSTNKGLFHSVTLILICLSAPGL